MIRIAILDDYQYVVLEMADWSPLAGRAEIMVHGRFSGFGAPVNWVAADILRIEDGVLVEHWDVIQDEATQEQSRSGRPMFGDSFPRCTGDRADHAEGVDEAAARAGAVGAGPPPGVRRGAAAGGVPPDGSGRDPDARAGGVLRVGGQVRPGCRGAPPPGRRRARRLRGLAE